MLLLREDFNLPTVCCALVCLDFQCGELSLRSCVNHNNKFQGNNSDLESPAVSNDSAILHNLQVYENSVHI